MNTQNDEFGDLRLKIEQLKNRLRVQEQRKQTRQLKARRRVFYLLGESLWLDALDGNCKGAIDKLVGRLPEISADVVRKTLSEQHPLWVSQNGALSSADDSKKAPDSAENECEPPQS